MNLFEDLIEELKDENLLEATVADKKRAQDNNAAPQKTAPAEKISEADIAPEEEIVEAEIVSESAAFEMSGTKIVDETVAASFDADAEAVAAPETDEAEFYRQRAKNEVAFLQIVEYVFAGIEREQLKIVPQPFDDLEAKKILHSFLQNSSDVNSPEHAKVQKQFLRQTEKWHSSLARRDREILTAHLRRYCETSRPPLGAPALIALARFYRNSVYAESVRGKFDLLVTRLFSKEVDRNRREMRHGREEMTRRLSEFYAEWSSMPLYSTETDDAAIAEIVNEFENFAREAEEAERFDDLINGSFFNRLHTFKRGTNANFFAPPVVAAAVEINIRVGNRYVELLEKEKETGDIIDFESSHGSTHDQTVSETIGRTLALVELLNQKAVEPSSEESPVAEEESVLVETPDEEAAETKKEPKYDKRLWVGAGIFLLVVILYFWLAPDAIDDEEDLNVQTTVTLQNKDFGGRG